MTTATACPDTLIIGVDASADGMAEASRRAARPAKKGGLPNALFVVAAAESLPAELDGRGDALTVHFPWGSLLRGLLAPDPTILSGLARVTRPGADLTILLSVTPRDNIPGLDVLDERTLCAFAPGYNDHGLRLVEARPATVADLAQSHSTWSKRLAAGSARTAWLMRLRRESIQCQSPTPTGGDTPGPDARDRQEDA